MIIAYTEWTKCEYHSFTIVKWTHNFLKISSYQRKNFFKYNSFLHAPVHGGGVGVGAITLHGSEVRAMKKLET